MSFFEDLYDRIHEIHTDILHALDGLPGEALDWVAGPEINPIGVLVAHLTGAERFWIGAVALGEPSDRVRDEEFRVHGLGLGELVGWVNSVDEYTQRALTKFSMEDLAAIRTHPRSDKNTPSACACSMPWNIPPSTPAKSS